MSNAKRFLSVVLAIIMVCSTLVIGANAAYVAYKNEAISLDQYNAIDQAVLTTDQYASAAMDEVDRMLNEEQLKFTRDDIVVGDVDLTSLDAAMDSIYYLIHGPLFDTLKTMLGDLQNLNVDAFRYENLGGVRRATEGKTDTDIIYAALEFIHDNANLLTGFVAGTLNLGSIIPSLIDISEFADVNVLLKGLLYEATYVDENGDSLDKPDDTDAIRDLSFDTMVQDLIDRYVVDELEIDDVKIGAAFEGKTNISSGTMYNFIDEALKVCYNFILVPLLNGDAKKGIREVCGVEYIDNGDGTTTEDTSNLNPYAELLNIDYEVPTYEFTSATFVSQLNNVIQTIGDAMVNPGVFTWQGGANSNFKQNVVNLGKAALVNTGDDFFASYIEVASPEEVEAMEAEELATYALRAIINASVDEMYIPEEATTIREFGYYALTQLLATSVPELDFSDLDKNSTDSLIVMGIDYAIYSINANLDMGLEYVYDLDGVDAQLAKAAEYGIENYGGLLSGLNLEGIDSGWELLDTVLFAIINANWIPHSDKYSNGDYIFKDFLIEGLINNILDLDFDGLFALFNYRSDSELQQTPKTVVLRRVASILNTVFPGAVSTTATTIDQIGTNAALAATAGAIFDTLWNERVDLVKCILPTLCMILDLTNAQEFEFPELTYDKMVYSSNGIFDFNFSIRNGSTGINTGYTDANGQKHRDTLYTYDVKTVDNNLGLNVDNPGRISGGETKSVRVNGSVSNESLLKITIKYDVLTEDGSPLTPAPIEEDVYIVLTTSAPVDGSKITQATAVGGFTLKDGPLNLFAKSVGDITGMEVTLANANAADKEYTAYSNLATKNTTIGQWVEVDTTTHTAVKAIGNNASASKFEPFKATDAYKALTAEERNTAWADYIANGKTYNTRTKMWTYPSTTYEVGATNATGTVKTTAAKVSFYNDFGLEGLVASELGKHRQASAYSSSTAWAAYQAALDLAVKAVNSPFTATFSTGKAANYEKAALGDEATGTLGLADAITALEETAQGAGVESLQAIIDSYNPDNGDLEYDDPDYNYFAVADYVDYTYYNYRDEYKDAKKMIDKATIPNKETGEVAVISELDKAYMEHRLSLYGSRLLDKEATNVHLDYELAQLTRTSIDPTDQGDWSDESWAEFQRAYAFATSVNEEFIADSTAVKQSKINKALDMLLMTEKELVKAEGSEEPAEEIFELVDPSEMSEEGTLFEYEGEETLILSGIAPDEFDPEEYFACTNCYVEVTENDAGNFSTGAVVEIIGEISDEVLATYTIAVYADVDGDCDYSMADLALMLGYTSGASDLTEYEFIAADIDNDEDVSSSDLVPLLAAVSGAIDIDYVNRVAG